ncbi:hypothetical protein ABIC03_005152 [Bradyrhizobium sp. RT6a]
MDFAVDPDESRHIRMFAHPCPLFAYAVIENELPALNRDARVHRHWIDQNGRQAVIVAVVDNDEPRQTEIDLPNRVVMRVRMVPKCRCRLVNREDRSPCLAGVDPLLRPAVRMPRHQQAMPMDGGREMDRVVDDHLHAISTPQSEDRTEDRR